MTPDTENAAALRPHKRIVELDALRALAAGSLVLFHFTHVYGQRHGFQSPLPAEWHYGAYGTAMFFMLSGYVNSMSLLRRRRPGDFLAARAIRIVPLFLIAVVFNIVLLPFLPPLTESAAISHHGPQHLITAEAGLSVSHVLANLTLMPHVFGYECLDPVMWTLQVEILFYGVLAGLFATGALRRPAIAWGTLLTIAWVACPLLDELSPEANGILIALARSIRAMFVLDQIPFFAIGYFLYRIRVSERVSWTDLSTVVFSLFVLHRIDQGKFNPLAIVLIACVVLAAGYGRLPVLRFKPLLFLSTVSYPLYLLHNNAGSFLIHTFESVGLPSLACVIVAIAFAMSVAVLMTRWCEEPLTQKLRASYADWRSDRGTQRGRQLTTR